LDAGVGNPCSHFMKIMAKQEKTLEETIEEKYGKGSFFRLSSVKNEKYDVKNYISTGSRCLNEILSGDSRCGIPKGHIMELLGPEGVGKSTIAIHAAAEANKQKIKVGYIDMERGIAMHYARDVGVDDKLFWLGSPICCEDAFEMAEDLIKNGFEFIIFDSVDAMLPRAILEGDMDASHMGVHARKMGQGIRKHSKLIGRSNTTTLFINQIRMKIGGYGNPETTTGGLALKYYAFIRVEIRAPRGGKIEEQKKGKETLDDIITENDIKKVKDKKKKKKKEKSTFEKGTEVKLKTIKNKICSPYQECYLNLIYGKGIDKEDDLIRYFENHDVLKIDGKMIRYPIDAKSKMGRDKFLEKIKEKDIKKEIKEKLKNENKESK